MNVSNLSVFYARSPQAGLAQKEMFLGSAGRKQREHTGVAAQRRRSLRHVEESVTRAQLSQFTDTLQRYFCRRFSVSQGLLELQFMNEPKGRNLRYLGRE